MIGTVSKKLLLFIVEMWNISLPLRRKSHQSFLNAHHFVPAPRLVPSLTPARLVWDEVVVMWWCDTGWGWGEEQQEVLPGSLTPENTNRKLEVLTCPQSIVSEDIKTGQVYLCIRGNVCLEDNWFILFLVTVDTSDSLYIVLLITDSNGGCVIFTAIS